MLKYLSYAVKNGDVCHEPVVDESQHVLVSYLCQKKRRRALSGQQRDGVCSQYVTFQEVPPGMFILFVAVGQFRVDELWVLVNYCRFIGVSELTHWPLCLLPKQPEQQGCNTHRHTDTHIFIPAVPFILFVSILGGEGVGDLFWQSGKNHGAEIIWKLMRSCGCWEEIGRCGFPDACWSLNNTASVYMLTKR